MRRPGSLLSLTTVPPISSASPAPQNYIEGIDQFAACSSIYTAAGAAGPAALTARDKRRGLIAFLRGLLAHYQLPTRSISLQEPFFSGLVVSVRGRRGAAAAGRCPLRSRPPALDAVLHALPRSQPAGTTP